MSNINDESNLPDTMHDKQPKIVSAVPEQKFQTILRSLLWPLLLLIAFSVGLGSGYLLWGGNLFPDSSQGAQFSINSSQGTQGEIAALVRQINPSEGFALPVAYGDIGPQLMAAGAIDYERFAQVYEQSRQPLTAAQQTILREGSDAQIVINRENAYFLLNFFWALGLTNQNAILTEGAMMQYGEDQVGRFASTGGCTLGAEPAIELYASSQIIKLTHEQQSRLEEVASSVYRPCCNNPTSFPDCNHGMAMLGLLELMASQDATVDQMFEAAKYANAFWFPQQTLELATFFKSAQGLDFNQVEPRQIVGPNFSSGSGFKAVHQILADNGLLEQTPGRGSSCGV